MYDMENNKVITGFLWRLFERLAAQLVTLTVTIILAKIIDPDVFGTIALINVFIIILQVFVDAGFGNALVQKKNADDLDFSSVFYFNIIVGIILYVFAYLCAPIIADFYESEELVNVIRVLSISFIVSGFKNIQQAYITRNMLFKHFFIATLFGTVASALVGVFLAYSNFGIWALVGQYLTNLILDTIILWITVKWRPNREFSFVRIKALFSYGWKLLVSAILSTGYNQFFSLILGKKYTASDLAYYDRGKQFPELVITNVNTSIESVIFPAMSEVQDNQSKVVELTKKSLRVGTYVVMPLMMGIAICAEPLVRGVLSEKWLGTVFYIRILCFTYALWPIHTTNLNVIKALGRSDLFLKLEITKNLISIGILVPAVFISLKAMAYSLIVSSILGMIVNIWPNKKLIGYGFWDQMKDVFPNVLISFAMGALTSLVYLFEIYNPFVLLFLLVLTGILIYIFISYIFKVECFFYLLRKVREIFRNILKGKSD